MKRLLVTGALLGLVAVVPEAEAGPVGEDGTTYTTGIMDMRRSATGATGANSIHLHVQARDRDGNLIDPARVLPGMPMQK